MGKKKGQPSNVKQFHLTNQSRGAVLADLKPFLDQSLGIMYEQLKRDFGNQVADIYTRVVALEELLEQKVDNFNREMIEDQMYLVIDRTYGLEEIPVAEKACLARIKLQTRTVDKEKWSSAGRRDIPNLGSGQTLGPALEEAIIGLKTGETTEVLFGKDNKIEAKITLLRASMAPKAPEKLDPKDLKFKNAEEVNAEQGEKEDAANAG